MIIVNQATFDIARRVATREHCTPDEVIRCWFTGERPFSWKERHQILAAEYLRMWTCATDPEVV